MATKLPDVSGHVQPPGPSEPLTSAPPKRRRKFSGLLFLVVLGGLGYLGYRLYTNAQQQNTATSTKQGKQANRAVSVVVATARAGNIPVYLRGLGTVAPFNSAVVKSRVDGQLIKVMFKEGDVVTGPSYDRNGDVIPGREGDALAQIDPRPFQVTLAQARGQLAKDQAQLKDAEANLARYQKLWDEQVIAKQQLDTQAASVDQFKGSIQADDATIANAQLQLTWTTVRAPLTGRAGLRLIDTGNMVHASDQNGIVVIDQMQPISVLFTIPADNLPAILAKLGKATLSVDAYDRDDRVKIASGTLLTVDNSIDVSTGTSRLKATFPNTDRALFPNQFVNCRLLLDVKRNAVLVGAPAIQRGPQGSFVYVAGPDKKAHAQNVTLGTTEGDDVEIASGLNAGDTVVVEGQDKLQDGSTIDTGGGSGRGGGRGGRGQGNPSKTGAEQAPSTTGGDKGGHRGQHPGKKGPPQ